jgi:hypothetical protein
MSDYDEYEYDDDEGGFANEWNAYERTGGGDVGLGLGAAIDLKRGGYTPEEKFKLIAVSTVSHMNETTEVLSREGIAHMLEMAGKLPDLEYKNPSAFVMGYIVGLRSNFTTLEIDRKSLESMFKINENIAGKISSKISHSDIIRYTRLCLISKIK